jgi:hypothetical protein
MVLRDQSFNQWLVVIDLIKTWNATFVENVQYTTTSHSETAYIRQRIKLCIMHKLYNELIFLHSIYSTRKNKTNFC